MAKNFEKMTMAELKAFFRGVIANDDFEYGEYDAACARWEQLTGTSFDHGDLSFLFDNQKKFNDLSEEDILKNISEINKITQDESFHKALLEKVEPVRSKVKIIDDAGDVVDKEVAKNLWIADALAAIADVSIFNVDNQDFMSKSKAKKKEYLLNAATDSYMSDLIRKVTASAANLNEDEEANAARQKEAESALFNGKDVLVSAKHFGNRAVSVEEKFADKADKYEAKGYKQTAEVLHKSKSSLSALFDNYIGPFYRGAKEIVKLNKEKLLTTVGVGVATLTVTAAFAAAPAVVFATSAAYTLYSSQTYRWRYFEKRNRMRALAEKNGEDTSIWEGWQGLRNARKAIEANPKEKKRLSRNKKTGLKAGLVGAGLFAIATPFVFGGAAIAGVTGATALALAKFGGSLARVVGVNANAIAECRDAGKDYKDALKDGNTQDIYNAKKIKKYSRITAGISLAVSALTEYFLASNLHESVNDAINNDAANSLMNNEELAKGVTKGASKSVKEATEAATTSTVENSLSEFDKYYANIEVPTEYSSELGGNAGMWNRVTKFWSGIFASKEGAEHLNGYQTDARTSFETAYRNIDAYMHFNPDAFPGKTPLEVMHGFTQRFFWSAVPENYDGDGHASVIKAFEGVNFAQYEKEMQALGQIICDPEAKIDSSIDLNAAIKDVLPNGGIKGVEGSSGYMPVGINCGEGAWKWVGKIQKKVVETVQEVKEEVVGKSEITETPYPDAEVNGYSITPNVLTGKTTTNLTEAADSYAAEHAKNTSEIMGLTGLEEVHPTQPKAADVAQVIAKSLESKGR